MQNYCQNHHPVTKFFQVTIFKFIKNKINYSFNIYILKLILILLYIFYILLILLQNYYQNHHSVTSEIILIRDFLHPTGQKHSQPLTLTLLLNHWIIKGEFQTGIWLGTSTTQSHLDLGCELQYNSWPHFSLHKPANYK